MNRMSKQKALTLLEETLADRRAIGPTGPPWVPSRPTNPKWERDARVIVEAVFGRDFGHVMEIENCSRTRGVSRDPCIPILESMIDEVKNTWPDDDAHPSLSVQQDVGKVFLVHGHDGEIKQTVARFLENRGLEVVILDEIAGQGRTIIEKFEDHSSVSYAVVLMTPDDAATHRQGDAPGHRARQNVVFELGFFVGTLKRGRVCVITRGDLEQPSNYWGVEYIPWDDAEGWKLKLLRELKAAKLAVSEG